eukprot:2168413-Heterocapsa_arctica.AAC.1
MSIGTRKFLPRPPTSLPRRGARLLAVAAKTEALNAMGDCSGERERDVARRGRRNAVPGTRAIAEPCRGTKPKAEAPSVPLRGAPCVGSP